MMFYQDGEFSRLYIEEFPTISDPWRTQNYTVWGKTTKINIFSFYDQFIKNPLN